jgi:methyl-accepting chemotaxis protein
MAKENNKAVEQTAAAAKKLQQLADDLQEIVGRFRTLK